MRRVNGRTVAATEFLWFDAAPTSFNDAGAERCNSGEAESRGRERDKGVWGFMRFHEVLSFSIWGLGFRRHGREKEVIRVGLGFH